MKHCLSFRPHLARSLVTLVILGATACVDPRPEADDSVAGVVDDTDPGTHVPGTVVVRAPDGLHRLAFRDVHGRAIVEGDIDLGPVERFRGALYGGAVHVDVGMRWPDGVVPFSIAANILPAERNAILDELAFLERIAPLDFVEILPLPYTARVEFRVAVDDPDDPDDDNIAGLSAVGRTGGVQIITLFSFDGSTILHETLHALGLWHEQSRPDRGDWIDYNSECVIPSLRYSYRIEDQSLSLGLYDFESIMHYPTGAFCPDPVPAGCERNLDDDAFIEIRCATMVRWSDGTAIADSTTLSREDLNTLWRMYGKKLASGEAGDHFGKAIATGDFDGDGYGDVAVGVPDEDIGSRNGSGRVHLMRGTSRRLVPWQTIDQGDLAGFAVEAGDHFGAALAAGDVDGDGKDDLLIGVPGEDIGTIADAGAAVLMRGSDGGLEHYRTYDQRALELTTDEAGDRFGAAVAIARHMAGIQHEAVVVIGAPGERNGATASGAAFLATVNKNDGKAVVQKVFDASGSTDGNFGAALATGSLDSGFDDLAVGAPDSGGRGTVHVYTGRTPTAGNPTMAELRQRLLPPSYAHDDFGAALAIGNVRGARASAKELVVGAPGATVFGVGTNAGVVLVYERDFVNGLFLLDRQTLTQPTAEPGDRFGAALAVANLDPASDQDDVAIGVVGENGGQGAVSIFRGNDGNATHLQHLSNATLALQSNESEDDFGAALAAINVDGIGDRLSTDEWGDADRKVADLIVGIPGEGLDTFSLPGQPPVPEGPLGAGAIGVFLGDGGPLAASRTYAQATVGNE